MTQGVNAPELPSEYACELPESVCISSCSVVQCHDDNDTE